MLILPLHYPLVLLPSARISLTLPDNLAAQLLSLLSRSDSPLNKRSSASNNDNEALTLAAVPITNAKSIDGEEPALSPWGCVARVTRLVRPSVLSRSEGHVLTLHGVRRVKIVSEPPFKLSQAQLERGELQDHPVENQKITSSVTSYSLLPNSNTPRL